MKRTLTLICALFLCVSIFTACGSNKVPQDSTDPTQGESAVPPASEQNTLIEPNGDDMIDNEIDITSVDDLLPEPDTLILHRDGKTIEISAENEYYDEIISAAKARIPEEGLAQPASALLGSQFDEILKIGNWLEFQYNEARKGKMLFMRKSYKDAGFAPYYGYSSIIFPLDNEHTKVFYTLPNQGSFGEMGSPDELLQILNKNYETFAKDSHSPQVQWILDNADDEVISPSYEIDSDIGIFHMLGTRVYVYVAEKEKYFADEAYEKAMIAAVKYFVFAAEGENELCVAMSRSQPFDISKLSDVDIFEKRPLYMHAPVKLSSNTYEIKLEFILSTDDIDIPADSRHSVTIELTTENGAVLVSNIT